MVAPRKLKKLDKGGRARANRQPVKLTLPFTYAYILENDVLRFKVLDHLWLLLVKQMDIGVNGVINIEAIVEVPEVDARHACGRTSLGGRRV